MSYTVAEIAASLGAEAAGDTALVILQAAEPQVAGPDDLALAMNPQYAEGLAAGAARVAMLWPDADWEAMGLQAAIFPQRPRFAMSGMTRMLDRGRGCARHTSFGHY